MKKILVLALVCIALSTNINAQNRHRLTGGAPFDVFVSLRGNYIMPQDNFKDNYKWGAGGKVQVEFQYQELKLSWGLSLGYDRFQPKTLKWDYLPTKQLFVAQQAPLTLFVNYYFFNEKIKPYVGIGGGIVWGRYDYSFSNEANIQEYYNRDFEGQSGFKFGWIPRVGIMFSLDHKNAFGLEGSMENYLKNDRLEKQTTYSVTLQYTYIID
jgi:opacity protein-like surface antigen